MIDRNIGNPERVLRFFCATALLLWIVASDSLGFVQGIAAVAALALLWNSSFGRCHLWKWLGISSFKSKGSADNADCTPCNSRRTRV